MTNPVWRKSSRSGTEQNACVEIAHLKTRVGVRDSTNPEGGHLAFGQVAFGDLLARVKAGDLAFSFADWRKSSHSGGESGQCVEVAKASALIGVRDSKNPQVGHLTMERAAFAELLVQAKAGVLDLR